MASGKGKRAKATNKAIPAAPASGLRAWWTGLSPLSIGIAVSVLVHAVVLSVQFQFPEASRFVRDKALDIVLVNARSAKKPANAQALAQTHLDGGGNTDDERRAKTPLPPSAQQVQGDDLETLKRRARELEARQQQLVAQAKRLHAAPTSQAGEGKGEPQAVTGYDLLETSRAMARLEGEIAQSVEEYNKRPRKQNVGLRAVEYRFARYIEEWRSKVERLGTLNYPEAARGKLYGSLVLTVQLLADGSVKQIEINRSSGHKVLDDAARRIVMMGSPYAAFPPDIRRDTDILEFTRTWFFTQGDAIQAR